MGALHAGHLSLIRLAGHNADKVIASVFVNPAQFAPNEDFAAYPRDQVRDADMLADAGCDLMYAPDVSEVYPRDFATTVIVEGVSAGMEGDVRPTHFAGVATVVAKLLIQAAADIAVFGEKDYQQLQVIRRLTRDLDLPTQIVASPIVRDTDGLALSSRNAYLSASQRAIAPRLYRTLLETAGAIASGERVDTAENAARERLIGAGFDAVDYVEVRDPESLRRIGPGALTTPARLLAVARLGSARLLDNIAIEPAD